MQCTSCSQPLPVDARFCSFCGQQVETHSDEARRVVTVLFADVVGFTAWSEHLDPERVKRLIDATFERLVAVVDEFGGAVDKLLGDGLLALFGAPVAHEDDPARALRAALEMHASLAEFNSEHDDLPAPIQLRVGVNTGEVLVGTVSGTGDYTAMGDVVNVAARLQVLAPAGEVYVGDAAARLAGDSLLLEVVDEIEVRGREQAERVWRLLGRRAVSTTPLTRHDRPFVGRESQRALLDSLLDMAAAGRSAVVAVSGEAGSGKTRLVNEVLDARDPREFSFVAGVCAPFGERNVWAPIAGALFRRLGLDPAIPAEELREMIRDKGVDLYRFERDEPRLDAFVEASMHLLGHPSDLDRMAPADSREALFRLVVEGIRRRSLGRPVVVWIDDLQWADPILIELLHRITRSLADRPLLVITAQRDEVQLDWPPSEDLPLTVRMPLDPLGHEEADQLVRSILGDAATDPLVAGLHERSGGNPLFLVELAEMEGEEPGSTDLPGSLRALIASRLDRLEPGPRAVLDNAAVLGTTSFVDALEMFGAEMGQQFDLSDLGVLVDAGLLEVEDGWWRFRSDVVRDVAYQTLTKTVRAQRHAGTAAVMNGLPGVAADHVAHHAATAAELVAEIGPVQGVLPSIRPFAVDLLVQSVRRSLDVGAFNSARRYATRALNLEPEDPSVARELLLLRARASSERRELPVARTDAQEALTLAEEAGDRRHEAIAHRLLGVVAQMDGDLVLARTELATSIELLRELGDESELATSLSDAGLSELFGGSLKAAERHLAEAEELVVRLDDRRGHAWVRQHQAWVAFLSGDTVSARERLEVANEVFEELDDQAGISWALGLLAYVHFMERDLESAEELAVRVRDMSRDGGENWAPAMMNSLLASIKLWRGDFAGAEEKSRRSLHAFREMSDRFGIVQALAPRMRALVALGRSQEAIAGIEEAMSIGESSGDLSFPTMAAAGTAAHLGMGERGVQFGESAVWRTALMGSDGSEALVTLALLQCQAGSAEGGDRDVAGRHETDAVLLRGRSARLGAPARPREGGVQRRQGGRDRGRHVPRPGHRGVGSGCGAAGRRPDRGGTSQVGSGAALGGLGRRRSGAQPGGEPHLGDRGPCGPSVGVGSGGRVALRRRHAGRARGP